MANPRAFISFDFDNNSGEKLYFAGQAKNSRTPFNIEDWSSKTALPQKEWEALIEEKINKCNFLVKEIAFAKSQNVPVFGVYVCGADETTTLPTGLQRNRTIAWEWVAIANAIDQVMKEGKNK